MISPTSARMTSGVNLWPPFATATVCVYGPDEDDEFVVLVASDKDALEVIEAEVEVVKVEAWAVTETARAARVATPRIIVIEGVFGQGNRLWSSCWCVCV